MKRPEVKFILALAALLLSGCGKEPTLMQVQAGGMAFFSPLKGEVLKWMGPDGNTVPVTFRGKATPCEEQGLTTNTCTVANDGTFLYKCAGCADGGIVVGMIGGVPIRKDLSPVIMSGVAAIYCDNSKTKVDPDPLTVAPTTEASVSKVQWFLVGNPANKSFSVNMAAGTCVEPTIDQDHNVCTLALGAPKNQTYQVAAACSAGGSADLHVQ
jgi:hypothetical protein